MDNIIKGYYINLIINKLRICKGDQKHLYDIKKICEDLISSYRENNNIKFINCIKEVNILINISIKVQEITTKKLLCKMIAEILNELIIFEYKNGI